MASVTISLHKSDWARGVSLLCLVALCDDIDSINTLRSVTDAIIGLQCMTADKINMAEDMLRTPFTECLRADLAEVVVLVLLLSSLL